MPKFETVITTHFGQIRILFDTQAELEERLNELDVAKLTDIVMSKLGSHIPREPQPVKPGLEGICRFRPDGVVELLKPPSTILEAIGLILYAYDPDPLDVDTIRKQAGADNPAAYLGHKTYGKYFDKVSTGTYRLSHVGKVWVTGEVIRSLNRSGGEDAGS
jgi:hypothetical protein